MPPVRRRRAAAASAGLPRELVVVAKKEVGLRVRREGVASVAGADVAPLANLLASEKVTLQPLFGVTEERLQAEAAALAPAASGEMPDLSVYYRVEAPEERLDEVAERLRKLDAIEAAYVKPPLALPQWLNDMAPSLEEAPPVTSNFTGRQGYLDPAPGGIDARYAWTLPGGGGADVRVTDLEGAWRFSHEDLRENQGGVVGIMIPTERNENHGTAVIGEMGADRNSFGVTGMSPDANVSAVVMLVPSAPAIILAASRLRPGDIMLLEAHRPGPRFKYDPRLDSKGESDQRGYIAIEWWPDDFAAILYATRRGIIVVEAAGNGAEDLDDPLYNRRPIFFPLLWTNPFNRRNRDSGAILVGAGAPPPGTHGRDNGPDRSRLDFSNYGSAVDAQGWGREVTTCGYGDWQGGSNKDLWYTDEFGGTSSASPIVVGALACLQGILRAEGNIPLTPAQARDLLRRTGSPQQDAPGRPSSQRIGNRPDLRALVAQAPRRRGIFKVAKDAKEGKDTKDSKELKDATEGKNVAKDTKDAAEGKNLAKDTRDNKGFKDAKDATEGKNVAKETKDAADKDHAKDTRDAKNAADNKDHAKDTRDTKNDVDNKVARDTKDATDRAAKDTRDAKNNADNKLSKDGKDAADKNQLKDARDFHPGAPSPVAGTLSLEERLAHIEAAVSDLAHFIGADLRPDLGTSPLTGEPDLTQEELAALSQELEKQAADAKQTKDAKDVEKLREG